MWECSLAWAFGSFRFDLANSKVLSRWFGANPNATVALPSKYHKYTGHPYKLLFYSVCNDNFELEDDPAMNGTHGHEGGPSLTGKRDLLVIQINSEARDEAT